MAPGLTLIIYSDFFTFRAVAFIIIEDSVTLGALKHLNIIESKLTSFYGFTFAMTAVLTFDHTSLYIVYYKKSHQDGKK